MVLLDWPLSREYFQSIFTHRGLSPAVPEDSRKAREEHEEGPQGVRPNRQASFTAASLRLRARSPISPASPPRPLRASRESPHGIDAIDVAPAIAPGVQRRRPRHGDPPPHSASLHAGHGPGQAWTASVLSRKFL